MNSSLNVMAVVTDEVTAVEIAGVGVDGFLDRDLTATGWSKKHPRDNVNPDIAFNLAMARALQDLANKYARTAADIAGFPVVVDLDGVEGEAGEQAAVVHFPLDNINYAENKVAF